jgi:hypothetical protein
MPKHHSLSPLRQAALALALVTALAVAYAGSAHADPVRVVTLRADSATGVTHYPSPGLGSPWVNLSGGPHADLENFHGNLVSGWSGKGTHSSPWRLYWGDGKQRGVFPAGSIAALQDSTAPVTAELWFKTGFNGPRPEPAYLLEWNQAPIAGAGSEYQSRGMSIAIQDGQLKVYQNDWVSGGAVAPNTWHHVAVVKAPNDLRIYLDGQRTYTGNHPLMGAQTSPLAIGCSVYHYYDPNAGGVFYGDYFNGSIAQVKVWTGALNDASVLASFQADSALYLPNDPEPALKQLVSLRADHSNGAGRYPIPGNGGPWVDLSGNGHPATLIGFAGTDSTSGWSGQGTVGSPYRLAYDGATNYAVIPAGSIPEMQEPTTTTTQLWFKTGRHADSDTARSLVQWLAGITSVSGMSLETGSGVIRIFRSGAGAGWTPMAPVSNNRWYQVTVVKKAGEMRVFLNGATVFSSTRPTVGAQGTDLVLGGDTWRGDGVYGEPIDGAIGQFTQWQGAMDDAAVRASFLADSALYLVQPKIITASAGANGTISPSGAVPVYVETDQAFTITADLCHVVADVVVDGVSKGPVSTYTFTNVLANHTIAATFGIFTPVITALAGPNGTISPAGAVATTCGGTMQFTAGGEHGLSRGHGHGRRRGGDARCELLVHERHDEPHDPDRVRGGRAAAARQGRGVPRRFRERLRAVRDAERHGSVEGHDAQLQRQPHQLRRDAGERLERRRLAVVTVPARVQHGYGGRGAAAGSVAPLQSPSGGDRGDVVPHAEHARHEPRLLPARLARERRRERHVAHDPQQPRVGEPGLVGEVRHDDAGLVAPHRGDEDGDAREGLGRRRLPPVVSDVAARRPAIEPRDRRLGPAGADDAERRLLRRDRAGQRVPGRRGGSRRAVAVLARCDAVPGIDARRRWRCRHAAAADRLHAEPRARSAARDVLTARCTARAARADRRHGTPHRRRRVWRAWASGSTASISRGAACPHRVSTGCGSSMARNRA